MKRCYVRCSWRLYLADAKNVLPVSVLAAFGAFCSLSYELSAARMLAWFSDQTVLWESVCIGVFLLGVGFGILIAPKATKDSVHQLLLKVELFLAVLGAASIPSMLVAHSWYRIALLDYGTNTTGANPLTLLLTAMQGPVLALGLLSGIEVCCVFSLRKQCKTSVLVACNHCGSLLAGGCHYLSGYWGIAPQQYTLGIALLNAILAISLSIRWGQLRVCAALGLSFVTVLGIASSKLESLYLKHFYYGSLQVAWQGERILPVSSAASLSKSSSMPAIKRVYSPYQVLDLVPASDLSDNFAFFLDGHFQFSTRNEAIYHQALSERPASHLGRHPADILVLGGGDGLLVRDLLRMSTVRKITVVELDPEVLAWGRSEFSQINRHSLAHPKVTVVLGDAFTWLRANPLLFDAILLDFPYPFSFEGLRLYSVEFLRLAAKHLHPKGYIAMDVPLNMPGFMSRRLPQSRAQVIYSSLHRAGFTKHFAFAAGGESFLVGWSPSEEKAKVAHIPSPYNSVLRPRHLSLSDPWK